MSTEPTVTLVVTHKECDLIRRALASFQAGIVLKSERAARDGYELAGQPEADLKALPNLIAQVSNAR